LSSSAGFIAQDIKKWQKQTLLKILFSFDVVLCQKVVHIKFFEDEINFEKSKKSPRKHQQGGNLEDSYSHEKFI
jgi:hypothetical protein